MSEMRCRAEPSSEQEKERLVARPTYSLGARPYTASTDEQRQEYLFGIPCLPIGPHPL